MKLADELKKHVKVKSNPEDKSFISDLMAAINKMETDDFGEMPERCQLWYNLAAEREKRGKEIMTPGKFAKKAKDDEEWYESLRQKFAATDEEEAEDEDEDDDDKKKKSKKDEKSDKKKSKSKSDDDDEDEEEDEDKEDDDEDEEDSKSKKKSKKKSKSKSDDDEDEDESEDEDEASDDDDDSESDEDEESDDDDDDNKKDKKMSKKDKKSKKSDDDEKPTKKKKGGGSPVGRAKYTDEMKITIKAKENPHKDGSPAAKAFDNYKSGMSVEKFLGTKGAHRKFLRRDARAGHIKVS